MSDGTESLLVGSVVRRGGRTQVLVKSVFQAPVLEDGVIVTKVVEHPAGYVPRSHLAKK